jgi:RimJ/RimL family protein N-acetyltransferase
MLRLVTLRVYERHLDAPAPPTVLPPGVEVAVADRSTAPSDLKSGWHPEAEQRFREGHACAIARHETGVVAYCWLACTPVWVGEIGHSVVPGPDDVYLYDAFTMPGWRGRGLFAAVVAPLLAFAHTRGRKRALIFVGARNRPSRRAIERAGFEILHTVTRVNLGGLTRLYFRGRPRQSARVTLVRGERG